LDGVGEIENIDINKQQDQSHKEEKVHSILPFDWDAPANDDFGKGE
jgi:hypothetical protein